MTFLKGVMMAGNKSNEPGLEDDEIYKMMPAAAIILAVSGFVLVAVSGEITTTRAGELVLTGIGILMTLVAIAGLPIFGFYWNKRHPRKE